MDETEDDSDDDVKYLAFVPNKNATRVDKFGRVCKQIHLTDLDLFNDNLKEMDEKSEPELTDEEDVASEASDLECHIIETRAERNDLVDDNRMIKFSDDENDLSSEDDVFCQRRSKTTNGESSTQVNAVEPIATDLPLVAFVKIEPLDKVVLTDNDVELPPSPQVVELTDNDLELTTPSEKVVLTDGDLEAPASPENGDPSEADSEQPATPENCSD